MGKPIIWSGSNAKLINSGDLVDVNSFSLSDGPKINFAWPSHGLTSADIGRPVRIVSANQLAFAQADTAANAEVAGFIYGIIDSGNVRLSLWGNCPAIGANVIEGGGTTGASIVYFLSDTTAGKITAAEPSNVGSISKPLAIGTNIGGMVFLNYRGNTVGSTNARTQISLANNSTTNMQNCVAYDAGSIEGWIYIDGTTDYRFYFNAPFSKYGAGGNYYISPSYVGDTPPAGFTITINSSGQSIVTLPSITGFVSATCTYSLNAPAVGTNFPLAIDGSQITGGTVGATYLPAATSTTNGVVKYEESSFTGTLTGVTTTVTTTIKYVRINNSVCLTIPSSFTGTSNTTACTVTGFPSSIQPATTQNLALQITNSGTTAMSSGYLTGGTLTLYATHGGNSFTASGTKGLGNGATFSYIIT